MDHLVNSATSSYSTPKPLPVYENTGVKWPESFANLLNSMMDKVPENRPSAREVLFELGKVDHEIEQTKMSP
jgi:hypothetical protein